MTIVMSGVAAWWALYLGHGVHKIPRVYIGMPPRLASNYVKVVSSVPKRHVTATLNDSCASD